MANALRILVTGGTGGIGRRLVRRRLQRGDEVFVVSRRSDEARRLFAAGATPNVHVIEGDPAVPGRWQQQVGEVDAVVHLAGAPIAAARWTPNVREAIRRSRVESTYQVAFAIRESESPPRVFVSASGTGRYAAGAEAIEESSPAGTGFLSSVAVAWEREALRAASDRTRVVLARIPTVLDAEAGYLARMVAWWRRGIDPTPWAGGAKVPWVHHLDLLRMFDAAFEDSRLGGPVNFVAPAAATPVEIREALRAILGRRPVPVPKSVLRLAAGSVIEELGGSRDVRPSKLHAIAFEWEVESVARALAIELGHGERTPVAKPRESVRSPQPVPVRPSTPPKPVEVPKPVVPPALVESPKPVEVPKPVVPPAPIESPKPVEAPKPVVPPAPIESPKPASPPAPVEPPKPVEVPKPVVPPARVEPPKPVEVPKPVVPPAPIESPKPVEVPKPPVPPAPIEPPKPVEVPKPVVPPAPVEPPKPVESPKPVVPPARVEPAKPVEAPKPVVPPAPIEPPKPVEAPKPVVPPAPIEPPKPVEAPKPVVPPAPSRQRVLAVAVLVPEALPEDRGPVREAIARWRRRGVETVLACSGGLESAAPLADAIGHAGPLILDLGACIRNGADRRLVRTMPIPDRVLADLDRQLSTVGDGLSRRVIEAETGSRRIALRLDLAGDAEAVDAGLQAIAAPHWQSGAIAVFRLGPDRAAIVAGGVDKSAALQRVLRGLGLPPSRVVVAAAADEDLGLVDWCRAIVVGTPSERLRGAAARTAARGDWRAVETFVAAALPGLEGLDA